MAKEFKLDPIITGAHEADLAAADLKAQNARVIYSLNFPTRPRTLAPDADEPARELRLRAHVSKAPASLEKAGIVFAFSSGGLSDTHDFLRNVAKAVKDGLADDAAVRALTINAARIAGAADRLGSIEKGKMANLVVATGDQGITYRTGAWHHGVTVLNEPGDFAVLMWCDGTSGDEEFVPLVTPFSVIVPD